MDNVEQEQDRLELREDQALVRYMLELVKLHEEQHVMLEHHQNIKANQPNLARPEELLLASEKVIKISSNQNG